ncbi:MAG: type II toxin-antitoxin system HicA family toxin [Dysgonamonadaceae bacterium]|nr:type II toxin-antitoxin system HicA family toxin [Dysgonamonadaceae bacterium]
MSKIDKLTMRLLSYPKDFTYSELKTLLLSFGYSEIQGAGSRVCFSKENHKIKLHKPHPDNKLKRYQLDLIVEELTNKGLIVKNSKDE